MFPGPQEIGLLWETVLKNWCKTCLGVDKVMDRCWRIVGIPVDWQAVLLQSEQVVNLRKMKANFKFFSGIVS